MIYLFTALYDEAYPFLQYYKMKKEINSLPFEMYRCEEQQICLTITGTGEITAPYPYFAAYPLSDIHVPLTHLLSAARSFLLQPQLRETDACIKYPGKMSFVSLLP